MVWDVIQGSVAWVVKGVPRYTNVATLCIRGVACVCCTGVCCTFLCCTVGGVCYKAGVLHKGACCTVVLHVRCMVGVLHVCVSQQVCCVRQVYCTSVHVAWWLLHGSVCCSGCVSCVCVAWQLLHRGVLHVDVFRVCPGTLIFLKFFSLKACTFH